MEESLENIVNNAVYLFDNFGILSDNDLQVDNKLYEKIKLFKTIQFNSQTKKISVRKRLLLNSLVSQNTRLLQTGARRGAEFISTVWNNKFNEAIIIDDFGGELFAQDIKRVFIENCILNNIQLNSNNILFLNEDYLNLQQNKSVVNKINLHLHFGCKNHINMKKIIPYYYDCFDDIFIFITDLWNYDAVKKSIELSKKECDLTLIQNWVLKEHLFIGIFKK